ncbi:MAG: hypothetical protein MI922_21585, partial [Bacteroidales bacterium]|nr:hypothetical protein [Bacteroidales bacterium]
MQHHRYSWQFPYMNMTRSFTSRILIPFTKYRLWKESYNMKKNQLIGFVTALLVVLVIAGCQSLETKEPAQPYNVLFIALDDLNDW